MQSLRRTKEVLIYRRAGNLRAVQILLGHSKIESTVRYLGVEIDDAIEIAEKIDIRCRGAMPLPADTVGGACCAADCRTLEDRYWPDADLRCVEYISARGGGADDSDRGGALDGTANHNVRAQNAPASVGQES